MSDRRKLRLASRQRPARTSSITRRGRTRRGPGRSSGRSRTCPPEQARGEGDRIVDLQRQLHAANRRIADLEKQLAGSSAQVEEPYSLRAEEKRQDARGQKKPKAPRSGRRGRLSNADKIANAEREVDVLPDGLATNECRRSHKRPVWRLENGRAVLVAYRRYPGS